MNIIAHIFLNGKLWGRQLMAQAPAVGDTVRLEDERYGRVTEVIWCLDEYTQLCQRVNLRVEDEK